MSLENNSMIQTLTHSKSGASCSIHAFGATVVSFKSADGKENLFLSREAKLDGSKAIRGGIPLCFPIFGPPPAGSTMPQHGFARCNVWKVKPDSMYDHEQVAGITYTLDLKDVSDASRGTGNCWSTQQAATDGTDCRLVYEIILAPKSLTTTLIVENTGSDSFDFKMLYHTYYPVDNKAALDGTQCHIHGLGGYNIIDKVSSKQSTQTYDEDVVLDAEDTTDRIYIHPDDHPTVQVDMALPGGRKIRMEASGMVEETPAPVSAVVWNPNKSKAATMSDLGNDEYADMICVEPGMIGHQPILAPGKKARMTQIIMVE